MRYSWKSICGNLVAFNIYIDVDDIDAGSLAIDDIDIGNH